MHWVSLNTKQLVEKRIALLDDATWRILHELGLACGMQDGPIALEAFCWLTHRPEQAVLDALLDLEDRALVERHGAHWVPVGWMERHARYLRVHKPKTEEQMEGKDLDTIQAALRRAKVPEAQTSAVLDDLAQGMGFDALFSETRRVRPPNEAWGKEAWREWAAAQRLLDGAPEDIQQASHLLYLAHGLTPHSKTWIADMHALLQIANNRLSVLATAFEIARTTGANLTFKSPRSFQAYVRAVLAKETLASLAKEPATLDAEQLTLPSVIEL